MTSKERMILAMLNKQPDRIPVAPDMSNMIPCRLTGKPFWEIYLYNDPPLWKAYIDAVKFFGFDGWSPLFGDIEVVDERLYIVYEDESKIITRRMERVNGKEIWSPNVTVYPRSNPPTHVHASKVGMGERPDWYKPIERKPVQKRDIEFIDEAKQLLGDLGVVGLNVWIPFISSPEMIYSYYDDYDTIKQGALDRETRVEDETRAVIAAGADFIIIGYSGGLTFQTPEMFRDVALPSLQKITRVAREFKIPSQVHCCGRSRALVEMAATETDLTSINPLEIPPMGDCDLAEVKRSFGHKIGLMGNLHTSQVMLQGTPELVRLESLKCIRDAGAGGGFILSTGDQCGRDTPDDNIFAMIDVVKEFGQYPLNMDAIAREIKKMEKIFAKIGE